jgi:hypothetical protein
MVAIDKVVALSRVIIVNQVAAAANCTAWSGVRSAVGGMRGRGRGAIHCGFSATQSLRDHPDIVAASVRLSLSTITWTS